MFNLHTHTVRCHHARGTDEEYVIKAIENGYDTIGFSDHAPYVFPNGHYSTFRMEREIAEDYVSSIRYLGNKYKDKIDVKLGFEVEWYPRFIEDELRYLKSFGYDYIILGQHYTGSEIEGWARYTGNETSDIKQLERYIHQVLQAANSGEFAYIAHPDIIHFTGDNAVYLARMRYMLEELKSIDIPLEFNFLGYTTGRHYPNDEIWKMIGEIGNRVVIGLDAHYPEVYDDKEHLYEAKKKLSSLGITPIEDINGII